MNKLLMNKTMFRVYYYVVFIMRTYGTQSLLLIFLPIMCADGTRGENDFICECKTQA